MKQNYKTIDKYIHPNRSVSYLRRLLDTTQETWYVTSYSRTGNQIESEDDENPLRYRLFVGATAMNDALDCFCRLMPDYVADLDEDEREEPVYMSERYTKDQLFTDGQTVFTLYEAYIHEHAKARDIQAKRGAVRRK